MASISSLDLDTGEGFTSTGGNITSGAPASAPGPGSPVAPQMEIVKGGSDMASTMNGLTSQWNQLANSTDPSDTSIRGKFLQGKVAPAVRDFVQGFKTTEGKAFAAGHAADMLDHFTTVTGADEISRMGMAVHGQVDSMVRNYTDMVDKDPTAADTARKMLSDTLEETLNRVHNAGPEQIGAMKGKIIDTALQTITEHEIAAKGAVNPDAMRAELDSGRLDNFINRRQGLDILDNAQRVQAGKQQATQFQAAKQAVDTYNQQGNQVFLKASQGPDPTAWDDLKKLYAHPGSNSMENTALTKYVSASQQQGGIPAAPDPGIYLRYMNSLSQGRLTRADVFNAMATGSLSSDQGLMMQSQLTTPNTNWNSINPLIQNAQKLLVKDPIGTPAYSFEMNEVAKLDFQARVALSGVKPDMSLDTQREKLSALLSPTSPNYVLNGLAQSMSAIASYKASFKTTAPAGTGSLAPPGVTPGPGQTASPYTPGMSMSDLAAILYKGGALGPAVGGGELIREGAVRL